MISIRKGTIIAGKYRIEEPLARGGMGSIWVARHIQLDVLVAVKFIDPDFASSSEGRGRFEREAKSAAKLHSPHVVQIHDYGVEYETPYIAMELLQGEDLSTRLKREGRLPLHDAAKIALHVSKALRRAHDEGIVHRDLKPSNIFIVHGGDEDEELIKVLDFGVAKMLSLGSTKDDETKRGALIGSPRYMSPEQARRNREIDHRSDLWSLGVILFRTVTGQLPFPGDEIGDVIVKICSEPLPVASEIASDLGPEVDRFFARALARDPAERFQSAREMAAEFAVMAGALPAASSFSWPLPGDGMRLSWTGITMEHTPSLPGAALIVPPPGSPPEPAVAKSNPTPISISMPAMAVAAPASMTMPSVEPAVVAVPVSVMRPGPDPISDTMPMQQPGALMVPPSTPTLIEPSRDRRRITDGTVLMIEPPASGVQRSGPPSSEPTQILPARKLPGEPGLAGPEEEAAVTSGEGGPAGDASYRPTPPTLVMVPPELVRRSSPPVSDVVSKGSSSSPGPEVTPRVTPTADKVVHMGPPSSDRFISSERFISSDRSTKRGPPSSDRGDPKSSLLDEEDSDASGSLPLSNPSATLTRSTGTVDIPAGRLQVRPRRPVALWIAMGSAVVVAGSVLAVVRFGPSGSSAEHSPPKQATTQQLSTLPAATSPPAVAPLPTTSISTVEPVASTAPVVSTAPVASTSESESESESAAPAVSAAASAAPAASAAVSAAPSAGARTPVKPKGVDSKESWQ